MKRTHTHKALHHFKVNDREWRCCGCGKVAVWDDATWGYFGQLGCPKCGLEPAIDFVACSDACRDKFVLDAEPMKALKNKQVEDAAIEATIDTLDKRIAALTDKRNQLREQARTTP